MDNVQNCDSYTKASDLYKYFGMVRERVWILFPLPGSSRKIPPCSTTNYVTITSFQIHSYSLFAIL
jgi:hypothetical protein